MLADLKQKAAGVDRKRIYTAAAALLIAGTAGHFMQRTSGATGPAVMTASIPPVSAPKILAAPSEAAPSEASASETVAIAPAPEALPLEDVAAPEAETMAAAEPSAPETPSATVETLAGAVADVAPAKEDGGVIAETVASLRPKPKPALIPEVAVEAAFESTPDIAPEAALEIAPEPEPVPATMASTGTASTAIYPAPTADLMLEEVTRAANDPFLTITEPNPARNADSVFAAASDPLGLPPATTVAPAEPEMAACAIDVQSAAKPGAMIEISVTAPCNSGESVAFEHAGLKFSEQLGPDGSLIIEVPAMTGSARIGLNFADGADRVVELTMPDFEAFDRIAVIWRGATGLQLHAFEGGASYGEAGHIWADTPGTPDAAATGTGGFISVLGSTSSGYAADVYTYPVSLMREGAEPDVSIEAQVMENTCGGEIEGWILRTNPRKAPNVEPLTMVVPGCEAVGEYLVLRDLPVELKLALR